MSNVQEMSAQEFIDLLIQKQGNLTSLTAIVYGEVNLPSSCKNLDIRLGGLTFQDRFRLHDVVGASLSLGNSIFEKGFSGGDSLLKVVHCKEATFFESFSCGNLKVEKFFCDQAKFKGVFWGGSMTARKLFSCGGAQFEDTVRLEMLYAGEFNVARANFPKLLNLGAFYTSKLRGYDARVKELIYPKESKLDFRGDRVQAVPRITNIREYLDGFAKHQAKKSSNLGEGNFGAELLVGYQAYLDYPEERRLQKEAALRAKREAKLQEKQQTQS